MRKFARWLAPALLACGAGAGATGCDAIWRIDPIGFGDAGSGGPGSDGGDHAHVGPFAHYPMDAVNGIALRVSDTVGSNDAICAPSCPAPTPGELAGALDFNVDPETTQRLAIVAVTPFDQLSEFSVSGWVQLESLDLEACLFGKPYGALNDNSWQLCIDTGGHLGFFTFDGGGAEPLLTDSVLGVDGTWHHVAIVFDGINKSIWLDAKQKVIGPGQPPLVDDHPVLIANDLDGGGTTAVAPVRGRIDDIQFFAYALTDVEVANLFAGN